VGENAMQAEREFEGLASDSRKVKKGYLFAAIPGTKTDGAKFLADAVARGASAVLGRPNLAPIARDLGVRFIADENPRAALARIAARFYGAEPEHVVAVTGTNGKTSVSVFVREILTRLGKRAASMGTIGVVAPWGEIALAHTTPDPVEVHRVLAELKAGGVDYVAIEASSHGLDQHRLDGVVIDAAALTNVTRDHLDYHGTFEAYLSAKLRLFEAVVQKDGVAVINVDTEHADRFVAAAKARGLKTLTVGGKGQTLALTKRVLHANGQTLSVDFNGRVYDIELPLLGVFQAQNALVAAGLAIALGQAPERVFEALAHLRGAPGRLEEVARSARGAPIYVDYAHTPDAVETVLKALRPHVGKRLHVVLGCGGDRDKGKRPMMGAAAVKLADVVIVTDDNPRSENAASIRKEILSAAAGASEIGDRAAAIREAIAGLDEGDVLVIAGKGHESGQIVGSETLPFSDRTEAQTAAVALGGRAVEKMP
jgi:UDP-N-acetylmuramoyl-L-alanyl-D-glutamate--2,6-diaminopimelate ligase